MANTNHWQIGDVSIHRVVEMEITGGTRFILPDATRQACLEIDWLAPHFMDASGNLIMSIHALVIDTGKRKILVDTCVGNDKERAIPNWSNLSTNFLADLKNLGYATESIDTVLCTHLHVDHVGWNTMLVDGEWVPTFPRARYLVAESEWQYWQTQTETELYGPILADSVQPIIAAGLMDYVATNEQICEEVTLESTPGHTPGHVSVRVRSQGEEALITGDCIHHPCQMSRLEWCSSADYDASQAMQTRNALLAEMAESDTLVIGTHFATPTAGRVRKLEGEKPGYWFDVGG